MSTLVSNIRSRPHADTGRGAHWIDRAACADRQDEFRASTAAAKAICRGCPVRILCLDAALQEEGTAAPAYRADVRGGRDTHERAALAGYQRPKAAPAGRCAGDMDEVERLLRMRTMSDQQITDATGVGRDSVGTLRRSLDIPPFLDPKPSTPQQRLALRTVQGPDGHLLWVGSPSTVVSGRRTKGPRLAFEVKYGRPPEGIVRRTCDTEGCVSHLTDSVLRRAARQPSPTRAGAQQ
ncbi:WhiB family transcriptional regulator [Streptomyces sp. NPDC048257]|uniref:WhiB family transcriptional regulator n=1 Tax=Streptomyces sp. NPDC048257 TaxID=3365526 RepID=UPI00371D5607